MNLKRRKHAISSIFPLFGKLNIVKFRVSSVSFLLSSSPQTAPNIFLIENADPLNSVFYIKYLELL